MGRALEPQLILFKDTYLACQAVLPKGRSILGGEGGNLTALLVLPQGKHELDLAGWE